MRKMMLIALLMTASMSIFAQKPNQPTITITTEPAAVETVNGKVLTVPAESKVVLHFYATDATAITVSHAPGEAISVPLVKGAGVLHLELPAGTYVYTAVVDGAGGSDDDSVTIKAK